MQPPTCLSELRLTLVRLTCDLCVFQNGVRRGRSAPVHISGSGSPRSSSSDHSSDRVTAHSPEVTARVGHDHSSEVTAKVGPGPPPPQVTVRIGHGHSPEVTARVSLVHFWKSRYQGEIFDDRLRNLLTLMLALTLGKSTGHRLGYGDRYCI